MCSLAPRQRLREAFCIVGATKPVLSFIPLADILIKRKAAESPCSNSVRKITDIL